ncbi:sortilin-related receptor-like [Watersipora subatra]|uniref:sortilin-related receptor-like n=1 Tax=Watersipora subatra TaxID=2589382 RepID=UPI00355C0224
MDSKLCDGIVDCLNGSDETVTRCNCSGGIECSLTDRCLPSAAECDGDNQCGDSRDWTDECFCDYGDYQVQYCNNTGRCLAPWQICDGVDDCGDMSDETSCPSVVMNCEYFSGFKYACDTFSDKNDRCIDLSLVCDLEGDDDCIDGSDETICNNNCSAGEIRCATRTSTLPGRPICIPEGMWCDGTAQCLDHSDENYLQCQGVCIKNGGVEPWRCQSAVDNDKYICINSTNSCNNNTDCAEQEDELCCATNELACFVDFKCIEAEKICDGVVNCTDGSDEVCAPCGSARFRCSNSRCIHLISYCNGRNDCGDNSDEPVDCKPLKECTSGDYRCSSGGCIDNAQECDGVNDCSDGSDEANCADADSSSTPDKDSGNTSTTNKPKQNNWKWGGPLLGIAILAVILLAAGVVIYKLKKGNKVKNDEQFDLVERFVTLLLDEYESCARSSTISGEQAE